MHALSTQSNANMGNDVNHFPIDGLWEKLGCSKQSPLFNIFRAEWHVNDCHFVGHILQTEFNMNELKGFINWGNTKQEEN